MISSFRGYSDLLKNRGSTSLLVPQVPMPGIVCLRVISTLEPALDFCCWSSLGGAEDEK